MIDLRFQPLAQSLSAPKGGYAASRFGCSWKTMIDDLERELDYLKATDIVVEADLERHQIRNDGWPRGSAAPKTPGIRLCFGSKYGPLIYECATYRSMQDNLRAIGMTLQRLRLVDEYGATKRGEQYTGWAKLPPAASKADGDFATVEDAGRFLCRTAWPEGGQDREKQMYSALGINGYKWDLDIVYRSAAKIAHPDAGGSAELMSKVNRAKDMIERWKHAGG